MNKCKLEATALVELKARELASLSDADLSQLKEQSSIDIIADGRKGKLNLYRESTIDGVRIITQAYLPSPSGFSAVVVPRGLLLSKNGGRRALREDEMYEYT